MTELADVRAALKEAEATIKAGLNDHSIKLVKPVASQADLDGLIADIKTFTADTMAAVAALSPPVPTPAPAAAPIGPSGPVGAPFVMPPTPPVAPPTIS